MEFPNNALTNFTIVNDFAEIVYLVCLALTSPAGGPDQVVPSSPVHTASQAASRLKEAEREFREIGILTAIDRDKGELFAFWRKPDLQRDGPSILGKVGVILRARSCRVSYRSGTRAVDLLHPGQSRLYRLFVGAILPSIRQALLKNHGLLPLGQTTFIKEISSDHPVDEELSDGRDSGDTALLDLRLQLLPIGQLTWVIENISGISLHRATALTAECKPSNGVHGDIVLLAPAGIIARLPKSDETEESQTTTTPGERSVWQSEFEQWMTDQGLQDWNHNFRNFIEVQIPTRRSGGLPESLPGGAGKRVHWETVSWPEHMCFCLGCPSISKEDPNSLVTKMADPLQFAEEWFLGAEARTRRIQDRQVSAKEEPVDAASTDLSPAGGLVFEQSPIFHRNTIAELQNANNIYPTPPDGALSQVTPGISSMDGIGATPAEVHRIPPERGGSADDHDMDDSLQGQQSDPVVGTGTYDEDLFGEMPTVGFGASGIADEPNWDFFDEQDLEMTDDSANLPIQPAEASQTDATGDITMTLGQDDDVESQNALPQGVFDREGLGQPASAEVKTDMTTRDTAGSLAFDESAVALERSSKESLERKSNNADTALGSDLLSDELHAVEQSATWRARSETSAKSSTPGQSRRLLLPDEKYGANGRFWFGSHDADAKSVLSARNMQGIPRLGNPRKSAKPKTLAATDSSQHDGSSGSENADAESSPYSDASDFSNSDHETDKQARHASDRETNRRWTEYVPTSPNAKASEQVFDEREARGLARQLLDRMPMDVSVSALTKFCHTRAEAAVSSYDGDNATMLPQIVVDQLTQSSLSHGLNGPLKLSSTAEAVADVPELLSDTFGVAGRVELDRLASLSTLVDMQNSRILNIDHFNISLRREESPLLASSTAMPFWESLALQPASGAKDITAFCVHPDSTNIESGCRNFLERISETYEHCSLGSHLMGKIAGTTNDGLVRWSENDSALPTMLQTSQRLGVALSKLTPSDDNIMIYVINPESAPTSVEKVGSAFIALWSAYGKACGKRKPNEVALQIVPVSFLASPDTVVVRPQTDYLKLAVEVYNRCPPVGSEHRVAACGSAVVLVEAATRKLHFDLAESAESPFAKDGRSLHLAYSQSIDERWITAAWTDPYGHTALTLSYSVRQRGSTLSRPLSEIIHAMWEVSMDLMKTIHSKWRLIVAKVGLISALEFNEWSIHANQDSASSGQRTLGLLLLAVNVEPSLSLQLPFSPAKTVPGSASQQQAGIYGTPTSTPYTSTTSPEHMAAATPTPSGAAPSAPTPPDPSYDPTTETDLTLSDPLDETWSVVLSHGLNQSESIFEARPALASGYLLKRKGALDADGVAILEVSVVHAPKAAPSVHQELLKEILVQYRGLVTLARTRGMIDPVHCVWPWHVATAVKGQRALSVVM